MNKLLLSFLALGLFVVFSSGCAVRTKILDTPAISMTRGPLGDGEAVRETGTVQGEYCTKAMSDSGSIGLLDESVKSVQNKYGVDYLLNATFWAKGSCVEVEATGAKVATGSSAAPVSKSPPATPKNAKKPARKKR